MQLAFYAARVAFSQDGHYWGVGGTDGKVQVWDSHTAKELFTFPGTLVTFTPDGKHVITEYLTSASQRNNRISGFFLDIRDLMQLARTRLVRTWTPEECQQYLQMETCPPAP